MMRRESPQDRANQTEVVGVVAGFLSKLPVVGSDLNGKSWFDLKETPEHLLEAHDFDIYYQGRCVGAGEVKCRHGKYNMDFFRRFDWLVSKSKLDRLYQFHRQGKYTLLVLRTSDGHVLMTTMKKIIDHPQKLERGELPHHTGNGISASLAIPFQLLEEINTGGNHAS